MFKFAAAICGINCTLKCAAYEGKSCSLSSNIVVAAFPQRRGLPSSSFHRLGQNGRWFQSPRRNGKKNTSSRRWEKGRCTVWSNDVGKMMKHTQRKPIHSFSHFVSALLLPPRFILGCEVRLKNLKMGENVNRKETVRWMHAHTDTDDSSTLTMESLFCKLLLLLPLVHVQGWSTKKYPKRKLQSIEKRSFSLSLLSSSASRRSVVLCVSRKS